MPTDYIIFVHGVNTREPREHPHYADYLFSLLKGRVRNDVTLKKVALYWGNINSAEEKVLLTFYQEAPCWQSLCFKELRENQMLQFTGDAALYMSRSTGVRVVEALKQQVYSQVDLQPGDRLHLVTHSMGTIILFDILFSSRWDADQTGGYTGVEEIRQYLFGSPDQQKSTLYSIHTLGSPIGMYSLMTFNRVNPPGNNFPLTHDITPRLRGFLCSLRECLGKPLPWRNYLHPADPLAYPLTTLLPEMINDGHTVDIQDILTSRPSLVDKTWDLLGETGEISHLILAGGKAHGSYWSSELVANQIAQTITGHSTF